MRISPERRREIMDLLRQHFQELATVPESCISSISQKGEVLTVGLLISRKYKRYQLRIKGN